MRAILKDYLENPSDKVLQQMTSEEQRYVAKLQAEKKPKPKTKTKAKELDQEEGS